MNQSRIEFLKKYISQDPDDPFNRYALAMEYYDEAPEKALELLVHLYHNKPNYIPIYYKLAHLYWELDEWDEAEEVFIKGIKLAEGQNEFKALSELKSAYQNFKFEGD